MNRKTADKGKQRDRPARIRCEACPVRCYVAEGQTGACDRYANIGGRILRCDPLTILDRRLRAGDEIRPFTAAGWDGGLGGAAASGPAPLPPALPGIGNGCNSFVTAIGAGTTYPDFKPAPFIVSQQLEGIDMITVVTEAIFSYCGVKVKIDTDRHLGPEAATVRADGQAVGHVTTAEYGSQMLSLGGVDHLTGGSKAEGRATCRTLLTLCNRGAVELEIDGGARVTVQAGHPPIVNGTREERMRVGCGSAAIGMFATGWKGLVDEVVVVDDHITGVVSEHQAGRVLGWESTGIRIRGHRSTPGRYFRVAAPGQGWGGTDLEDPRAILGPWNPARGARPGLSLLMISTTGEHHAYYELNEALEPVEKPLPGALVPSVQLIAENCEPALCSVLFMGGAGGSLRAGVTRNPVRLTRSVQTGKTRITVGGAEAWVWPGGGITLMADVLAMPEYAFGDVPTPALVAPLEFTLPRDEYERLGGHADRIRSLEDILERGGEYGNKTRAIAPLGGHLPWQDT